uniref:NUDE_C domain-containing protein n=1 Tax=Steinernema glaseri TaxID=37863 RepID=A0A1I8AAN6_9BILA
MARCLLTRGAKVYNSCRTIEMSNNSTELMELEFYKKEVTRLQELLEKEQRDFDEYQTDSRDLEESLTKEIDDLKANKNKLLHTIDILKSQQKTQSVERHDRERRDLLSNEQRLTKLLEDKNAECEQLKDAVRSLELENEALERSHRTGMQELSDLSDRLNSALERVVLAESELTETTQQNDEVHRLKQENNYLREELEEAKKSSSNNSMNGDIPDTCICEIRNATNTLSKLDTHAKAPKRSVLPIIKDPIGVIIKMNQIVRDLLLKVDEMESKMSRLNSTSASNTSGH